MASVVDRPRPRRIGLLQVAVSLTALAGIVWWGSRQRAPHVPVDARSLAELAGALALYVVATSLRAERWHRILVRSRLDRGRGESYRLTAIGYMGNNTLPARAGDLMKVVLLGGPRRGVLGTVIAERLLDVGALAVIFAFVVLDRGLGFGPLPYLVAAGVSALVVAAALWRFAPSARRLLAAREWARPAAGATKDLVSAHGAALLVLSLTIWLLEASVYLVVGRAVDIHLGATSALYVTALTNLSAAIPAAPGYVGTYDAAVLLALRSLHHTSDSLGYLLILRFILFVPVTLVGFVLLLVRQRRRA